MNVKVIRACKVILWGFPWWNLQGRNRMIYCLFLDTELFPPIRTKFNMFTQAHLGVDSCLHLVGRHYHIMLKKDSSCAIHTHKFKLDRKSLTRKSLRTKFCWNFRLDKFQLKDLGHCPQDISTILMSQSYSRWSWVCILELLYWSYRKALLLIQYNPLGTDYYFLA